jgi:hypothetical protein
MIRSGAVCAAAGTTLDATAYDSVAAISSMFFIEDLRVGIPGSDDRGL